MIKEYVGRNGWVQLTRLEPDEWLVDYRYYNMYEDLEKVFKNKMAAFIFYDKIKENLG